MTPSDDPFDTRPTADLLATDALLDRVGARAPIPDDLDDPLIAALALMAAEIDLDAVPVDDTRAALARAVPELAVPASPPVADGRGHDQTTGLVIDLRDSAAWRAPRPDEPRSPQRRPRQPARRPERAGPPVAMAPPRSLPRMPAPGGGPAGSRSPRGRGERTLRPMVAVAVAVTAIVLGTGVSAALTGGRSVNPLDGIQQVVADLTHGRTQDQLQAHEQVDRYLDAAQKYARAGDTDAARTELGKIGNPLLRRLTDDDRKQAVARIAELRSALSR